MLIFKAIMIICSIRYIWKTITAKKTYKGFDYLFSAFGFALLSMIEKVV